MKASASSRGKAAKANGKIKGLIWWGDGAPPEDLVAYTESLNSMIGNHRVDPGDLNLPFIIGVPPQAVSGASCAGSCNHLQFSAFQLLP